MKEKRKYRRLVLRKSIHFGVDNPFYKGFTKDISLSGAKIASPTALAPGSKVSLAIENNKGEECVKAKGVIRWIKEPDKENPKRDLFHMGVELTWHDEEYFRYLADLIEAEREKSNSGKEQREHFRHKERVEVIFDDPEELIGQFAQNISRGGIFVNTDRPLAKGREVSLRMVLPQIMSDIEVKGKVAFSIDLPFAERLMRPPGMGIKFIRFENDDKKRFFDYLEKLVKVKNKKTSSKNETKEKH